MREIKFRFWDFFNAVMKYSSDCVNMIDFFYYYESALNGGNKPRLMQWTGLKDANGKDIYEGDIVKSLASNGIIKDGILNQVGFMDGLGCYPFVCYPEYNAWNHHSCIVVGNIYENPKLMES